MKMKRIILLSASVAIVCTAGLHLSCDSDPSSAGNGSDTPNAAVGKLVYANGDPAAGANVTLYASGADPRSASPAGVAVTGSDGRYVLTGIEAGPYNVLGAKDNARSFSASNDIAGADTTVLPTDTLRETGSVCGVVKLVGDIDTADIYLLVLGTGEFAEADTGGRFCLDDMAPGEYSVRILTTVTGFGPKDTTINVQSGVDITLLDTVWVNSSVIPVPRGLALHYDTLRQIVTLTWNQADTALVSGYNVYRRHQDSGLVKLSVAPITDTIYSDSAARQDESYTYQVKALDKDGNEGLLSREVGITAASLFRFVRVFAQTGSADGEVLGPIGITVNSRRDVFVVDWGNHRVQKYDSTGQFLMKFGSYGSADSLFTGPVDLAVDSQGSIYVLDGMSVKKFGSTGVFDTIWATKANAQAIAMSPDQRVYVATSHDQGFVQGFSVSGDSVSEWQLSAGAKGIDVATNGQVFVSTIDGAITVFEPDGNAAASWPVVNAQQGCRFSVADTLVYAAIGYDLDYVAVITTSGSQIARFGGGGANPLMYPKDVAVFGHRLLITAINGIQLYQMP